MTPIVQIVVPMPMTLTDLEAACAAAREHGMGDGASVAWNLLGGGVTIRQPAERPTEKEEEPW